MLVDVGVVVEVLDSETVLFEVVAEVDGDPVIVDEPVDVIRPVVVVDPVAVVDPVTVADPELVAEADPD